MQLVQATVKGLFIGPLPAERPEHLSKDPSIPGIWNGVFPVADNTRATIFRRDNTIVATLNVTTEHELETAMALLSETMTNYGLPPLSELRVLTMVFRHDSGIQDAVLSAAAVLDTFARNRHEEAVTRLRKKIGDAGEKLGELEAARASDRGKNHNRLNRAINETKTEIEQLRKKLLHSDAMWERLQRPGGITSKRVRLTHGTCTVFSTGKWLFTGQRSHAQAEADLAEMTALVEAPHQMAGLAID